MVKEINLEFRMQNVEVEGKQFQKLDSGSKQYRNDKLLFTSLRFNVYTLFLFAFCLFTFDLAAQPHLTIPQPNKLSATNTNAGSFSSGTVDTAQTTFQHELGFLPIRVDSIKLASGDTSKVDFEANQEQIDSLNSRTFNTSLGEWDSVGNASFTLNGDGTATASFDTLTDKITLPLSQHLELNQGYQAYIRYKEGEDQLISNSSMSGTIGVGNLPTNFTEYTAGGIPTDYTKEITEDGYKITVTDAGSNYIIGLSQPLVFSGNIGDKYYLVLEARGSVEHLGTHAIGMYSFGWRAIALGDSLTSEFQTFVSEDSLTTASTTMILGCFNLDEGDWVEIKSLRVYERTLGQSIEEAKLIYIFGNQSFTLDQVTDEYQDATFTFFGDGVTDSIEIYSDTENSSIKIDSTHLKKISTIGLIKAGGTFEPNLILDVSENGNFSADLTIYSSSQINPELTRTVTWSVDEADGDLSGIDVLAVVDSTERIKIDWDDDTTAVDGYYVYRSTDNVTYSLYADVFASEFSDTSTPYYADTYYKVSSYRDTSESSLSSYVVGSKQLDDGLYTNTIFFHADSSGGSGTISDPYGLDDYQSYDFNLTESGTIYLFMGGTTSDYIGQLEMLNVDDVKFVVYGEYEYAKIRHSNRELTDYVIVLAENSHSGVYSTNIVLQGLEVEGRKAIFGRNTTDVWFDYVYVHHYLNTVYNNTYGAPDGAAVVSFNGSWQDQDLPLRLTVTNSIFIGAFTNRDEDAGLSNASDLFGFRDRTHIYIEDSWFQNINHALLSVGMADKIVVKNSGFYNLLHSAVNLQGVTDVLFEGNSFFKQGINLRNGYLMDEQQDEDIGAFYFNVEDGIFRNSLIRESGASADTYYGAAFPPFQLRAHYNTSYNDPNVLIDVKNNRVYNNNFYDNYTIGIALGIGTGGEDMSNNKIYNNVLTLNGDPTYERYTTTMDSIQVYLINENSSGGFYPEDNEVTNNYLGATENNVFDYYDSNSPYDANNYPDTDEFLFSDNVEGSYSAYTGTYDSIAFTAWKPFLKWDFHDSLSTMFNPMDKLVDLGKHSATITTGVTNGTSITVNDGYPFFDGHSWKDADSIVITNASDGEKSYARISSINRATGAITLNQNVTASVGDYVDPINERLGVYKGSAPDLGMYEKDTVISSRPTILAYSETSISSDSAKFSARIAPNSLSSDIEFRWVVNAEITEIITPIPSPISNTTTLEVLRVGLEVGESYDYQWYAENSKGSDETSVITYTHEYDPVVDDFGSNLLASSNNGFESGDLTDWTDYGSPTTTDTSTTTVYAGSYSGHVVGDGSFDGIRSDAASVTSGKNYKITFWYYIVNGSLRIIDYHSRVDADRIFTTSGVWTKAEFNCTGISTGNASLLFHTYSGSGEYYIDEVSIQEEN